MTSKLILYVDDEPDNCKWFSRVMNRKGYDVVCLNSIDDARHVLSTRTDIDVLIMDYLFENGNETGVELILELNNPRLLKIVLTALMNIRSIHDGYVVLYKPLDYDKLVDVITRHTA